MDQNQVDEWAINDALMAKLPTRETEWRGWVPTAAMRSGIFKMTDAKCQKVYWAYYDYVMACPWYKDYSAADRMQQAHFKGRLGIAYLECRCRECRFISRTWCPESYDSILAAYEGCYPEDAQERYGYVEEGREGVDEDRFIEESSCLMMGLFRRRYKERQAAAARK